VPGKGTRRAETYRHGDEALLRPEAGTQAQFRKKKAPTSYRYDSSLSPALDWDDQNSTRELGEWLLARIEEASRLEPPHRFPEARRFGDVSVEGLHDAIQRLEALSGPFLNWTGKAERLSFDVSTLPLFVHERLSTKAILATLKAHERDRQAEFQLFGDPQLSLAQQLEAYEHMGGWVNRLILGDSLVVMNSLLEYEGLGGQVQMIYIDPPYGVQFGSNFQPFVRKRDVKDGDDASFTREPEMVKAYRDTWELGYHSYLTYLRDRLLLARELLTESGSVFVQISGENLHHVRELVAEIFGDENFISVIPFRKKTMPLGAKYIESVCDYLIWYAKDIDHVHFQQLYVEKSVEGDKHWNYVELSDGARRRMTPDEIGDHDLLPKGAIPFQLMSLYPVGVNETGLFELQFRGSTYRPPTGKSWFTNESGMLELIAQDRIEPYEDGQTIRYVLKFSDSPVSQLVNLWSDTSAPRDKLYVVETNTLVVQRCMLMATRPGDLVLDPTCGSGTTAYVAEHWGRRWITIDTSRVPLALARQRLVTATFPYYKLLDPSRGPAGGFSYAHRENRRGEQVGGVLRLTTRGSIASGEPPEEVVRVDRPETEPKITRVAGPFCMEATIPTAVEVDGTEPTQQNDADNSLADRMLEALRRNPVLQLPANRTITLKDIRPPARSLSLAAEATLEPDEASVALVLGPENGAVSEKLVFEAAREAHARSYERLVVIGFAIEAGARELVEKCDDLVGIAATYVQATPDLIMGDLLKTMRSSQIFSVAGLPDVAIHKLPPETSGGPDRYQVDLRGVDVFDPTSMEVDHRAGTDVPAWFLDTDYTELCFHVSQAFFPRTSAWDNLKRALKGEFDDEVWEHLAGTTSAPFLPGATGKVAIKVVDDRGNELLVVKTLDDPQ
jgi:adenine-specific DNA-methyltransferase